MRAKIGAAIVGVALLALLGIFFAPMQLGGSTSYSVTSGISMQPLLYQNDLAVVRAQSSYHVGDIVLYESAILHRQVLHRIIKVQDGHYFFKGDNNDFVDPGYATRSELLGAMWFRVPEVGGVLSWIGKPVHAALLAGLSALLLIVVSGTATTTRRRRRGTSSARRRLVSPSSPSSPSSTGALTATSEADAHDNTLTPVAFDRRASETSEADAHDNTFTPVAFDRRASGASAAGAQEDRRAPVAIDRRASGTSSARTGFQDRRSGIAMTPQQVAHRRAPSYLDGPTGSLIALGTALVLALLLCGIGFSHPTHRTTPLPSAYEQTGTFSYQGAVTKPTAVYPSGLVTTGEPIFPTLVNSVTMKFQYKFESTLPHHITGTIGVRALVLAQTDTWQRLATLKTTTTFSGDTATVSVPVSLKQLYALIDSVTSQSGLVGENYSADIQPFVHISGVVGGHHISQRFLPVLPFAVSQAEITLDVASAPAPPGATYVLPSASAELASTLKPAQFGTVPHFATNVISVAKYDLPVPLLRVLGLLFAALAIILTVSHDLIRRRQTRRSDEELIAARLHTPIVPVVSLVASAYATETEVPGFLQLAGLAKFLERPILYEMAHGRRTFAVDDEERRYIFRPVDSSAALPPLRDSSVTAGSKPPSSRHRSPHRVVTRGAALLLVLVVAATLGVSFTASTTVPVSSAGASVQPLQISQLAPAGCSTLTLTGLVQGTGTFSNSRSNTLVLGSAAANTISDTGSGDCIVGGGGGDTITGTATDICISGPTLNVAAPCASASNGVTATPSSTNYLNYGGQEVLTLSNSHAITALTITIHVAQTTGVTYGSEYNSLPAGSTTQSESTSGGVITYTWVLNTKSTIPTNQGGAVYADFNGIGYSHAMSGDTWSVTSTSNGITSTLTGTF
jgi:signal peptidase I